MCRTRKGLGALIRERRRRNGWDQQTLADKIGVSRQWVIEIEKGKPRAEVGLVLRALDALGIDLSPASDTGTDGLQDPLQEIDIDEIVKKPGSKNNGLRADSAFG
ncbi:MAG: helix-turn-helix transcriptional regulator [Bdellovibrionales bacterium]|nr:helix-turn-helix transcriptional regulator [Bdellovibrionales bacterium]